MKPTVLKGVADKFTKEIRTAIKRHRMGQVDFAEDWIVAKFTEACEIIVELQKDLAHETDMNAQGRAKELDIDDVIDNLISRLDFDHIIAWAEFFDIDFELPPIDDMYPDWENELSVEIGKAMRKVGEKNRK